MTIYTAIFGDYEELKEPKIITPAWEYVCYTDQPFKSDVWKIAHINTNRPVQMARVLKIVNGWEEFPDKSIWVDGSFTINCDLNKFWEENFISPMTVIQHPIRDCWFAESLISIKHGRGNPGDVIIQQQQYLHEVLPMNSGLIQSGILLRENTEQVNKFCKLWWEQIKLSTRDQIGFAYAEWKFGIKWPRIKMDYRENENFIFKTHKHRRKKYEL